MSHAQHESEYPVRTHKSRPSLTTNASGIAESTMTFGSLMSGDGLTRLSQFPAPPASYPFSSFSLQDAPSPVVSQRTMTPTGTIPYSGVIPLNEREHHPDSEYSPLSPQSTGTSPRPDTGAHLLPNSTAYPPGLANTPTTATSASQYSQWNDVSSNISANGYGDQILPTSFITSLLSSVAESDPGSSHSSVRGRTPHYEPSVLSNAYTIESTITYPPPKMFPPPLPTPQYQTLNGPRSPVDPVLGHMSPVHAPQRPFVPIGGRDTPETVQTNHSRTYSDVDSAVIPPSIQATGSTLRTMSLTPSLQSAGSSSPLIPETRKEATIPEGDEFKVSSPSTPTARPTHNRPREKRLSTYSSKTTKSYVSSLISRISHSTDVGRKSAKSTAGWFRKKPMTPVPPVPNMPFVYEIRRDEEALPLPDLVNRAQTLSQMLDHGHRPHQSVISFERNAQDEFINPPELRSKHSNGEDVRYTGADPTMQATYLRARGGDYPQAAWSPATEDIPSTPSKQTGFPAILASTSRRRIWCTAIVLILVLVGATIGIAVGVTIGHKSEHSCAGNLTGNACTLDATCVCVPNSSGQCSYAAQSLINLVPDVNRAFNANVTQTWLSTSLWQALGSPTGSNCASQANFIDVAPALDSASSPNRTQWAQVALLWNLVQSQNTSSASQLQQFVQHADWKTLGSSDGVADDSSGHFAVTTSGYEFNFAVQTITAPPVTFAQDGQPSQTQISRVNDVAKGTLDRMYTYAYASSRQQKQALTNYWTTVLQQKQEDLSTFISLVRGSPILLPFDATLESGGQKLSFQLTNSSTTPFPPPLACYPGLSSSQLQQVNSMETTIFKLPSAQAASTFDTSCYPNRPIYGVLDLLQLRTPFVDGRTGLAKQAAVLNREASTRAVVYSGEALSGFPGTDSTSTAPQDVRQYGTLNHINHVIYKYLTSISDVNVAIALVKFILGSPAVPPTSSSPMFSALSALPTLEVAVFGTVNPSDISSTVSSLSDPSGNLFFGTDQSLALRQWTIMATQTSLAWTELAVSPQVVRDNSFDDANFNSIWNSAFTFFHIPNDAIVKVGNITTAFEALKLYTP